MFAWCACSSIRPICQVAAFIQINMLELPFLVLNLIMLKNVKR